MTLDLRTLLIDCRIALRTHPGEQVVDALSQRLEAAIHEVTRSGMPVATGEIKSSATQVALAWQTACRGLKLTHPQLYAELNQKVMDLLDERELHEPVEELLHLQGEVERLKSEQAPMRTRMDQFRSKAVEAISSVTALREALAKAVPYMHEPRDPQQLALAQIAELESKAQAVVDQRATGNAPAAAKPAAEDPIPGEAVLNGVVAGERGFTEAQREWVVGEALGLTGWKYTPVELLAKGDAWLARCMQLKREPPGA
ncbi:hypothetical protein [Pseudomarimonas arenosa]|uniref:Uncharacterized protein n=1 Tax=Pseudomarimonas arenosa TaxID=2774145 RepID=A0AAW3ZJ28_9GAMM|nr:hypothetical protein [Pseudomarimonas arenosa]MBD8525788.1 hypothetical protein [Pseudomarimonas arenosa]